MRRKGVWSFIGAVHGMGVFLYLPFLYLSKLGWVVNFLVVPGLYFFSAVWITVKSGGWVSRDKR